jgi:hypothetical protein
MAAMRGHWRMRKRWLALAALVLLAALAWGYHAHQKRKEAELQLGLDSARVLSESFRATNQLKVSDIEGTIVASANEKGLIDLLDVQQSIKAPYSVDYFIDMKAIDLSDFAWNPDSRTMVIAIPDPIVARPNIDMSEAEVSQRGLWVSRNAGISLQRKAAATISAKASETARSTENMKKARIAALKAIEANAMAPLRAAGVDGVTVRVTFRSQHNTNDDVWDYTLPYEEVARRYEQMQQ